MRKMFIFAAVLTFLMSLPCLALAHFGMLIPSESIVAPEKRSVDLTLSFSHPFEMAGMELVKPKAFFAVKDGEKIDLLPSLTETKVMDHTAWAANYKFEGKGASAVYQFAMEPVPYWEPAEDCSIIHYTKTIVAALGGEEGWDKPLGVKTEIIPMLRPFGNYAGDTFVGLVLLDGKPVANAEVEVEYYNKDGKYVAPSDYHVTQVIKADNNGVFSFTCPLAGWWGFAALNTADYKLKDPEGNDKDVELGAVLWIEMSDYKKK